MIASKRVPAAYRKQNRVSHLTADAVRQMGYVLEDSGKKLTVGQQRRRRRTQRGGTVSDTESANITQEDIDDLEALEALSDIGDSDDEAEPQLQPSPTASARERRAQLVGQVQTPPPMAPGWRTRQLVDPDFNPSKYVFASDVNSQFRGEDEVLPYTDFELRLPQMRNDMLAVEDLSRRYDVFVEYVKFLEKTLATITSLGSSDSDAQRIAAVEQELDWARSQKDAVRVELDAHERQRHDADVAAHHGFGAEQSVGPDAGLHVDDAQQSMYASQRGAASPRRHSIDLGALSPIAGTNVGDSSVAAIGNLDASVGSLDTSVDQLSKKVEKLQGTTQAAVDTARLGTMGVPANQVATVNTIVREDPEIADMVRRGLVKPASLVYPSYVKNLKRELRQSSAVAVGPDGNQLLNADGEPRYTTSTSRPNTLHRGRIARSRVPVFERNGSVPSRRTPGLKYFRPARASRPDIFATA